VLADQPEFQYEDKEQIQNCRDPMQAVTDKKTNDIEQDGHDIGQEYDPGRKILIGFHFTHVIFSFYLLI